jgi:glutathione S-transferase
MLGFCIPPILYTFRRCPYAIRARLALQVTARSCELREVVLRDKPASMLEASPKGTVPVLVQSDGSVLEESLDIMLWTLRLEDPQGWLAPARGSLEEMIELITRNDEEFKFHLDRYKYSSRHEGAEAEEHRKAASGFLRDLEARLAHAPWLFGERLSLADAALAPFVRQFANTDREWFDAQPWPALVAWLVDFLDSPLFTSVMPKHAQWKPGDDATIFPSIPETGWLRS